MSMSVERCGNCGLIPLNDLIVIITLFQPKRDKRSVNIPGRLNHIGTHDIPDHATHQVHQEAYGRLSIHVHLHLPLFGEPRLGTSVFRSGLVCNEVIPYCGGSKGGLVLTYWKESLSNNQKLTAWDIISLPDISDKKGRWLLCFIPIEYIQRNDPMNRLIHKRV